MGSLGKGTSTNKVTEQEEWCIQHALFMAKKGSECPNSISKKMMAKLYMSAC